MGVICKCAIKNYGFKVKCQIIANIPIVKMCINVSINNVEQVKTSHSNYGQIPIAPIGIAQVYQVGLCSYGAKLVIGVKFKGCSHPFIPSLVKVDNVVYGCNTAVNKRYFPEFLVVNLSHSWD